MQADSCSLLSFISKLEFGCRGGSAGIGAANNDAFAMLQAQFQAPEAARQQLQPSIEE
jgi:hypothetical protein